MFSFLKREINHPKLKLDMVKAFVTTNSNGDYDVTSSKPIPDTDQGFDSLLLGLPLVPTSLHYEKGRLKSIKIFRPFLEHEELSINIKHAKKMKTIPLTIEDKNLKYVNGVLLMSFKEPDHVLTNMDWESLCNGFFAAIKEDIRTFNLLGYFTPLSIDNGNQVTDTELLINCLMDDFYFIRPLEELRSRNITEMCYFIKDKKERNKLIPLTLVNKKADITFLSVVNGILMYNSIKGFFSSEVHHIDVLKQQEISTIENITFINIMSGVVFANLELSTMFDKFELKLKYKGKNVKLQYEEYTRLKPSIGDKVLLNIDELSITIVSVIKENRTKYIPFPGKCPLCSDKLEEVTYLRGKNKTRVCRNNKCRGYLKDKIRVMFTLANVEIELDDIDTLATKVIENRDNQFEGIFNVKKSHISKYFNEEKTTQIYDTIQSLKYRDLSFYIRLLTFVTTHRYVPINIKDGNDLNIALDKIVRNHISYFETIDDIQIDHFKNFKLEDKVVNMFFDEEGECKLVDYEEYEHLLELMLDKVIMI